MAAKGSELFRKESMERLSSPERLDQLLRVADPKSWAPLATAAALLFVLLVWSIVGVVPVHVEGQGMLIEPRRRVELHAPGDGRLAALDIRVGQAVAKDQVLGKIARPDLDRQLELRRARRTEIRAESADARTLHQRRTGLNQDSSLALGRSLEEHIGRSDGLAQELQAERIQATDNEIRAVEEQLALALKLTESRRKRLDGQRALHASGIISDSALDDVEQDHGDSLARVSALSSELYRLKARRLESREEYFDRLQRVADLKFALRGLDVRQSEMAQDELESDSAHERELASVESDIARLEQELNENGRIVSMHAGRIIEVHAAVGEFLEAGDPVGTMMATDGESALIGVTYFKIGDGKRISLGKPVQLTPDSVERERFGGILGTVHDVSPLPVTAEEAANVLGNPVLASSLVQAGYQIQVFTELRRLPAEPHDFVWSSSRHPDFAITAGTTATARIAVEQRHPIALVFPILKSAVGVD